MKLRDGDYGTAHEGLYCLVCGAESGNTDLCVLCAIRTINSEAGEDDDHYA